MTSMVLAEKTAMVAGPVWTDERVSLVKKTCCPSGISDNEFALFMEQCRRTGLDPLIKQAFCVPRSTKVNGQWVTVHVFQPSESGMLARADDFPDYRGTTSGAVYAKDSVTIDPGAGTVVHTFNPAGDRGPLVGAWSRTIREGRTPNVKWLLLKDYVQKDQQGKSTGQWASKEATMIQKCAKVAGLRDEFPKVFGGIYIPEELPNDEGPRAPAAQSLTLGRVLRELAGPETHEGEVVPPEGKSGTDGFPTDQPVTDPASKLGVPTASALLRKCKKLIDDAVKAGDLTALAGVGVKIPGHFEKHLDELAEARTYFAAAEAKLMEAPAEAKAGSESAEPVAPPAEAA